MTDKDRALRAVERASGHVVGAEDDLRAKRSSAEEGVKEAVELGVILSAIGRAIGVSRQRLAQMLEDR
jgi:hypothetical protein